MIEFTVNGKKESLAEQPGEMLADLLRYRLGLTGTKVACNEDECGACTVLIDGEPVLSCTYPAVKVAGRSVTTKTSLAPESRGEAINKGGNALLGGLIGKRLAEGYY